MGPQKVKVVKINAQKINMNAY